MKVVKVGLRSRTLFAHYFLRRLLSVPGTFFPKIVVSKTEPYLYFVFQITMNVVS